MAVEEKITINDLLKEVQEIDKELQKLEARRSTFEREVEQITKRQRKVIDQMYPLRERQRRLVKAVDALTFETNQSNWREWPWVKEAEFSKRLPSP